MTNHLFVVRDIDNKELSCEAFWHRLQKPYLEVTAQGPVKLPKKLEFKRIRDGHTSDGNNDFYFKFELHKWYISEDFQYDARGRRITINDYKERGAESEPFSAFFSYANQDKITVAKFRDFFEKKFQIKCFMAHEDIQPAAEWREEIIKNLQNSRFFVIFLSELSIKSDWCSHEIGFFFGKTKGKNILPIQLDATIPTGLLAARQAKKLSVARSGELAKEIKNFLAR